MAEGELNQTWKDDNIVDFWKNCDLLSNKIIKYNPAHFKYTGEANMRPAKQQNQSAIEKIKEDTRGKIVRPSEEEVQFSNFVNKNKSQVFPRCQLMSMW